MDQERIDRIARALATGQSRRSVLKGLTGAALGGFAVAAGLGEAAGKPQVPCKTPNTKYGKGRNAVCCTPDQTYDAFTNACVTPIICTPDCTDKCGGADDGCGGSCDATCPDTCTPDCTGKCGGASDGCDGTCDATCPNDCAQVDCNIAMVTEEGQCWYTPDYGQEGEVCHNLYYGTGDGVCDGNGNCVPPS